MPDDKFKQGARYYLLTILAGKFTPATPSLDRLALIRLVQDFLNSNAGSVEGADFYEKMREWAGSIPAYARSIAGTWREDSPYTLLNVKCSNDYRISVSSNGEFEMLLGGLSAAETDKITGVLCDFKGTLAPKGDGFVGEITRGVILDPSKLGIGAAEQKLRIEFGMSEDLQTIEGTATGGAIIRGKFQSKVAADLLRFPPGPTGPWHFTLHRKQ